MRSPSARFLKDTVVVHAPGTGKDAQNTPTMNAPGAPGSPLACSVQEVRRGLGTSEADGMAPYGVAQYELLFDADPGVARARQLLEWTGHAGVAFGTPIPLFSTGAARPPHGLAARWTVSATRPT